MGIMPIGEWLRFRREGQMLLITRWMAPLKWNNPLGSGTPIAAIAPPVLLYDR